jgi:hypothetical protein
MNWNSKPLGIIFILCLAAIPIFQGVNKNKKLKHSVISYGEMTGKVEQVRRTRSLKIKFMVLGQPYFSYFTPSYDAFKIIPIGTKFQIEYAESDPDISRIVFLEKGHFNFHDSGVSVPGKIYNIINYRKFNFFLAPVRNKEVYYEYFYHGIRYANVRFVSKNISITEGTEYLVEFPKDQPEKGTINMDKPFNILEMLKNANMNPDTTHPQTIIRDTVINGDTTKVIERDY